MIQKAIVIAQKGSKIIFATEPYILSRYFLQRNLYSIPGIVNGFKVRICCPNSGAYRIIPMKKLKVFRSRGISLKI
jgi:hypothetical protein